MNCPPSMEEEERLYQQGYRLIAGIDEVGRGCIAGPVVAAAVILPFPADIYWLSLVRDSKQLSPSKRQVIYKLIQETDIPVGLGMVSNTEIDELGIVKATQMAMIQAVENLPVTPEYLLIDAMTLPGISIPQKSIIHGDGLSLSIASASIMAKVSRDQFMVEQDSLYPGYGLARHKGYGTREHISKLEELGPCPIHRLTFAPVWRYL